MAVISRRTIGQIVLAYDDGVSPPTEILPVGSLVSVADGTLWISQGAGVYASVGNPQNYPDVASLPTPVPNAGTVASIGPGTPIARRTFYVSDGTQWVRAPDNAGLRYAASSLALLPDSNDGAQNGDQALVSGTLTGVATRVAGVWVWTGVRAPDKASLPTTNATGALAYELLGGGGYIWSGSAWVRMPASVEYQYEGSTLASLPGAAEGVLDGDVAKLTGGTITGSALRTGGAWQWTQVNADSFGDLPSASVVGAISLVGTTTPLRTRDAYLYEDAVWNLLAPDVRSLSSWTDVQGTDQDGAVATYTDPITGIRQLVRLTAALPLPGGGTRRFWVPEEVYSLTGLTVRSYLDGTETIPLTGGTIQGNTVEIVGGSASIQTTGSVVRFASTTSGHYCNLRSTYALQPTDKFYSRTRIRASIAPAVNVTAYYGFLDAGTGQPQYVLTQNPTFNGGIFARTNLVNTLTGTNVCIDGSGSPLPSVAYDTLEVLGLRTGTGNVETRRNAIPYLTQRRNAVTGTSLTIGQKLIQLLTSVTGASWVDVAEDVFFTGT